MMNKTPLIAGSAALLALGCASAALAQAKPAARPAAAAATAPAAAAPAPITANIPGVCLLSREAIIATSSVGKAIQARMQQLNSQVNAELTSEGTTLQNDVKSFQAKAATLQPAQQQQQQQALQTRAGAFQDKQAQRERELQATEQKAVSRVLQEASPLVGDQVKSHNCAILLDANSVMAANQAMDITSSVVTALNGKITTFDFEREKLQPQQQ